MLNGAIIHIRQRLRLTVSRALGLPNDFMNISFGAMTPFSPCKKRCPPCNAVIHSKSFHSDGISQEKFRQLGALMQINQPLNSRASPRSFVLRGVKCPSSSAPMAKLLTRAVHTLTTPLTKLLWQLGRIDNFLMYERGPRWLFMVTEPQTGVDFRRQIKRSIYGACTCNL